jgi:LacI family transcriptional regulator
MSDIARGAGVHVTTVSLALRNHPRIPISRRNKIRQLAIDMGYRPDPLLQALIAHRSRTYLRRNPPTLAYVTNWNSRFGWKNVTAHPQFYLGAKARASQLGYNLEHFWLGEPGLHPKRLSQILRTRSVNGLVVASQLPLPNPTSEFEWQYFSAVKIDHVPRQLALHNVTNDHMGIIRLAVKRAVAAGYKRIGLVMHCGWNDCANRLWSAGFLSSQSMVSESAQLPIMMFRGAELDPALVSERNFNPLATPAEFARWYKQHRPDVILSKSSFVMPSLRELGLRVPDDVAFVDLFLEDTTGELAGVRQNHELVGATAVEILAGQIHLSKLGVPAVATSTLIEGTWFDGQSCPLRWSGSPAGLPSGTSGIVGKVA